MAIAPPTLPPTPPGGFASSPGTLAKVVGSNRPWLHVAFGICAAGAAYPMLVVGVFGLMGMCVAALQLVNMPLESIGTQLVAAIPAVFMIGMAGIAAGCVGALWTGFVSLCVVPVFFLFAKSLHLRASIVWLGAICGGVVAFVAFLPFLIHGPGNDDWLAITLVGPGLATIAGQLGGAWGGAKALGRNGAPHVVAHVEGDESEPLLRFRLRHLFWITAWLALILTLIRLADIPFEFILPVLPAWLVYSAATLYSGRLIVRRLLPWWRTRSQGRST